MKLGLIIPYRDRKEQLEIFINIISKHLQNKNIDYYIIVVEQKNNNLFNRSKLLNIGANYIYNKIDYLCFHDIDLIPEEKVKYLLDNDTNISHYIGYLIKNKNNEIDNNIFYKNKDFNKYFLMFKYKDYTYKPSLGGVTMIKNTIWRENPWNELFQLWGYEDNEYYIRLKNLHNYKIKQEGYKYISLHYNKIHNIYNYLLNFSLIDFYNREIYYNLINRYIFENQLINYSYKKKKNDKNLTLFNSDYKILNVEDRKSYKLIQVDFDDYKYSYKFLFNVLIYYLINIKIFLPLILSIYGFLSLIY